MKSFAVVLFFARKVIQLTSHMVIVDFFWLKFKIVSFVKTTVD